jgi:putative transcriptional regulator
MSAGVLRQAYNAARWQAENGGGSGVRIPPRVLRKKLHMTQPEFAKALRIPLATLRNWEQGRVLPDPAARSLLTIVAKNPRAALRALAA